jgi:type III restriction enzyme
MEVTPFIHAADGISGVPKCLYEREVEVNSFELDVVNDIVGMDNVLFWHRNIERHGFCLNGFVNHYPDYVAVTRNNNVHLVETKGDDRDNTDSERKLRLGQAWEKKAGDRFKYFMVFQTVEVPVAFTQNKFASIAGRL